MSHEISLKSHQYLDANNVFEKKSYPLVDRCTSIFLLPVTTFAASSAISIATDNPAGLLLPTFISSIVAIPGIIFSSRYTAFRRNKKLLKLCKKAGLKLTEANRKLLKGHREDGVTFDIKLNHCSQEISISCPDGKRTELMQVEKIPNKVMNAVMYEAITLKRDNVRGGIEEENFTKKDNMTDFEQSVAKQMEVTNKKFSGTKWYWTVAKNNAVTFDDKEVTAELSKVEKLYRDDLESRLTEHLQDS